MIELKNIIKKFGDHTVLNDISLLIAGGENFGLAGDQDGADGRVVVGGDQGVGHGLIHDGGDGVLARGAVELEGEQAVGGGGMMFGILKPYPSPLITGRGRGHDTRWASNCLLQGK